AQAELWEERQQVLKGLGIHDGGPRVMTYFKVSLSTCNWDRALKKPPGNAWRLFGFVAARE
ncbi:hypothetical protein, partial [Aeromonas sp. sif2433]|uniref:hypothetical protein n=1 Tax=Aeromonas sp. sif2433 TaxID=2854794 RepID=UPI001C43BF47